MEDKELIEELQSASEWNYGNNEYTTDLCGRALAALSIVERGKSLAWDLGYFNAVGGPDEFTPLMGQLDFGNPFRFEADEGQWLAMRALDFIEATA